jgi:phosphocarrier protein FPr
MLPMVTERGEVETARAVLDKVHADLTSREIAHAWPVKLGVMIEVPAAALCAGQLAEVSDFFSIGTNDLTQYTLAAERGHAALGHFSDAAHPAVLALVEAVIEAAEQAGLPVSVCGEAAGDEVAASLLIGLGIRKLSVGPALIRRIAGAVAASDVLDLANAAARALAAGSAQGARSTVIARSPYPD